uniref:Uncharacterized protein n=1 Tax=Cyprinus carpio TaxID=7962 RepID=A0A8C1U8A2_CYPCA
KQVQTINYDPFHPYNQKRMIPWAFQAISRNKGQAVCMHSRIRSIKHFLQGFKVWNDTYDVYMA